MQVYSIVKASIHYSFVYSLVSIRKLFVLSFNDKRREMWGNFADSLSVCVLIKDNHSNMLLITFYDPCR